MRDQAARLRELTRRHRGALTIAVLSGKGGVGKSSIAVNLSICFRARGFRTLLIDVDMGLANADLLLGVQPRYTLAHVAEGIRTADEILIQGPGDVAFLPGGSGFHNLANLSEFERHNLIRQLQKLENNTDIAVLDCGAGLSKNVTAFAQSVDQIIVVTTPQPTALTDAYAMIKVLCQQRYGGQVGLLVNMVDSRREAEAVYRRLSAVAEKFLKYSVADLGYVVHDKSVGLAVQARCPFVIRYPGANASACLAAVAGRLATTIGGRRERGGFFRRVAGLFV